MSAISEATNNSQLEKKEQQKVLLRMARALINTYAIHQSLSLALVLRVSPSLTNEQAVACWMKQSLQHVDMELADSVFGTICNCSGLMILDTNLGENARHREVSDETTSYVFH